MTLPDFVVLLGMLERSPLKEGRKRFEQMAVALRSFLAETFTVQEYEVSFFIIDEEKNARFVLPTVLNKTSIPLYNSTVTRKVYESGAAMLSNTASDVKRFSVYERMKDVPQKVLPIQKFMALPVKSDGSTYGVLWVNRRAETFEQAGPDFTQGDLDTATQILETIGPIMHRVLDQPAD